MSSLLVACLLAAFPALVIVAALRDATSMTIPNWISLALIVAFIPAAVVAGLTWQEAAACVGLGLVALAAGVVLFALRWVGGGDAKLFAAAMLWLGAPAASPFMMWTALAGGALSLALIGARRVAGLYGVEGFGPAWAGWLLRKDADVPYGIAIAAGALAAFTQSPLVQGLTG